MQSVRTKIGRTRHNRNQVRKAYNQSKSALKIEKGRRPSEEELVVKEEEVGRRKTGTVAAGISVQPFQADRDPGRETDVLMANHRIETGRTFPKQLDRAWKG